MKGAPVKISNPVVSFCETVRAASDMICLSKSPNKHNRIFMTAEPLGEDFCKGIDNGEVNPDEDVKLLSRKLADEYGWNLADARKIWSFGLPPECKGNVLVDTTKACQYLNEMKDSCVGAFLQGSAAGCYAEEIMRGIRFNINDVTCHADAIHRGAGQMMPTVKRVMYACQMKSKPAFMEPMYMCDITVPEAAMAGVYATLNKRRGVVEGTTYRMGTPLVQVKAYLPVLESFGFTQQLRANTSGQAFPQMIFSHWQLVPGEIEEHDSQSNKICLAIRLRKGLKTVLPAFDDFYDKL